ncbi:hypothetical protein F383_33822 [Gossypium arboreum]|uniref:Uncharacterized protein n=1 Tax=Gossypium arboreum TaxID=29729 RepID=A0A0B0PJ49_GOSAR|nr:hypothetical protein F383_33822 [Gossypium arboreum]
MKCDISMRNYAMCTYVVCNSIWLWNICILLYLYAQNDKYICIWLTKLLKAYFVCVCIVF